MATNASPNGASFLEVLQQKDLRKSNQSSYSDHISKACFLTQACTWRACGLQREAHLLLSWVKTHQIHSDYQRIGPFHLWRCEGSACEIPGRVVQSWVRFICVLRAVLPEKPWTCVCWISNPLPPSHSPTILLYLLDLEENNSLRPDSKHLSEFIETISRKSTPAGNLTWNKHKVHVVREEGTWVLSMFSASSPLKQSSCFSLPSNGNYRHLQFHQNEGQR